MFFGHEYVVKNLAPNLKLLKISFRLLLMIIHYGQNIYYSPTYMHYLRDYRARISLPIFTGLVNIQARISLPKRVNLCSAKDHIVTQLFIHDVHKVWSQWTNFDTLQGKKTDLDYIGKTTSEENPTVWTRVGTEVLGPFYVEKPFF